MQGVAFERIFLPIVEERNLINEEAKASEVPMDIGTENERKCHALPNHISISFLFSSP